jgi:putative zinc finger/helix-turn-helix YgiT family protein
VPKCGEQVLTFTQARRFEEDAIGTYRKKYGLLSSDEIRAVCEGNGLTQAELAKLLRPGANTISRWEAGRNVQSTALDVLLRLIRDLPGSVEYLRDHAA